jgi:hypothetical protein
LEDRFVVDIFESIFERTMNKSLLFFLFISASFSIYSQCISGDCQNGYGHIIFNNSEKKYNSPKEYRGNFSNGEKSGYGELTLYQWENYEKVYRGFFKNDSCCSGVSELIGITKSENKIPYLRDFSIHQSDSIKGGFLQLQMSHILSRSEFKYVLNGRGVEVGEIELPKPTIKMNAKNSKLIGSLTQSTVFTNSILYKDRFLICEVQREYNTQGYRKYWISIIDLDNLQEVKSIGSYESPVSIGSSTAGGGINILGIDKDHLFFSYNQSYSKPNTIKCLNLQNYSYVNIDSKKESLAKLGVGKKGLQIETVIGSQISNKITIHDSTGSILENFNITGAVSLLYEDEKFYILSIYNKPGMWGKPTTLGTLELRKYFKNGKLHETSKFDCQASVDIHPYEPKYIVAFKKNNKNYVAEYSIDKLDSLIQEIYISEKEYQEYNPSLTVHYSPSGKYIRIGQFIFKGNEPYFITYGDVLKFDEKLFLTETSGRLWAFDLNSRSLLWSVEKESLENDNDPKYSTLDLDRIFVFNNKLNILGSDNKIQIDLNVSQLNFDDIARQHTQRMLREIEMKKKAESSKIDASIIELEKDIDLIDNSLSNGRSINRVLDENTRPKSDVNEKITVKYKYVNNNRPVKCSWCNNPVGCSKKTNYELEIDRLVSQPNNVFGAMNLTLQAAFGTLNIVTNNDGSKTIIYPIDLYSCPDFCSRKCEYESRKAYNEGY